LLLLLLLHLEGFSSFALNGQAEILRYGLIPGQETIGHDLCSQLMDLSR